MREPDDLPERSSRIDDLVPPDSLLPLLFRAQADEEDARAVLRDWVEDQVGEGLPDREFENWLAEALAVELEIEIEPPVLVRYSLRFFATVIPPRETVHVRARPQIPFRGERLIVPWAIATAFSIHDIFVGPVSQLLNGPAGIPATFFTESEHGIHFAMDTAGPDQEITLVVENTTDIEATFHATFIGSAAAPQEAAE